MDFNRGCSACDLQCGRAVGWTAPADLRRVRLVVLSDYPGHYETQANRCMVSNDGVRFRNPSLPGRRNAGSMIRYLIGRVYGLNHETDVYYTNAVKCNPRDRTVLTQHVQACAAQWLVKEFNHLDEYAPTVPLLVAGSQALKALVYLDPAVQLESLAQARRRLWWVRQHPTAVTFNPAVIARSEMRLVTHVRSVAEYRYPLRTTVWDPPLPGSALDFYLRDLLVLKPYIDQDATP